MTGGVVYPKTLTWFRHGLLNGRWNSLENFSSVVTCGDLCVFLKIEESSFFFFLGATFSLTLLFKNPKIGFLKMDFWAPSEKPIREVFVLAPLADAATSGMMRRQKATKKVHETWSRKVDATKCHLKILQNYFCFPGSFLNLHVFFCQI